MDRTLTDRIADAVLYEGYILYPYRPSMKNRQRWTFGGLYPEAYSRASGGADACANQTECLIEGGADAVVDGAVRFLHLTDRRVGVYEPTPHPNPPPPGGREAISSPPPPGGREAFSFPPPPAGGGKDGGNDEERPYRSVETLRIGAKSYHSWQEAEEREIARTGLPIAGLLDRPRLREFAFPGGRLLEPLHDEGGAAAGVLAREQQPIAGTVEVGAVLVEAGLYRLTVRVVNRTPFPSGGRDDALLRSLISAHTILGVQNGAFVSLLDPPEDRREAAGACRNVGVWPVLVGEAGRRDAMLSSPIILYDYPEVAPESPGDFFDGAEIDEMLTLRILTLTDDEKRAMAAVDHRARELLARTEAMGQEQMLGLHGALRPSRSAREEEA